jgi:hypothetical protein
VKNLKEDKIKSVSIQERVGEEMSQREKATFYSNDTKEMVKKIQMYL